MLSRTLVFAMLFCALETRAQAPLPEFDASIPDASVGSGGAEKTQETDEGRANTICTQSRDCERGFSCTNARCSYVGYRMATQPGCLGGSATLIFPLIVLWRWRRRAPG